MTKPEQLIDQLRTHFADDLTSSEISPADEITIETTVEKMSAVFLALRDDDSFQFDTMIDICGVDYLAFGVAEWQTEESGNTGFSRGVDSIASVVDELVASPGRRFASVYHLLSTVLNHRLRVRVYAPDNNFPAVQSVTGIWRGANWFERESFDLFGIVYEGHPDLRRLLTDYGFIGHPFRKDFPLSGHVEMRYDAEQKRVIYQPVSIKPRVLVPRVIRDDSRYVEGNNPQEASTDA